MTATATARPSLPRALARMLSLDDFEQAARRLPRPIFGYIAGAAEDNQSLRANRDAFARYGFVPRVLVNVSAARSNSTCSAAATTRRSASRPWA